MIVDYADFARKSVCKPKSHSRMLCQVVVSIRSIRTFKMMSRQQVQQSLHQEALACCIYSL